MVTWTKKIFSVLFLLIVFLNFSSAAYASESSNLPTITVINLIRGNELGHEKHDLVKSLEDQWKVTKEFNIRATWLAQYGALNNKEIVHLAKKQMSEQEFGIFLEVDRNFAEKSGVGFRGQGPWYFSDGLLLLSYDENERRKLIDEIFKKFKEEFGYYPKTVGAWWIGADSLTYMQEKYGITGALRASDQFDLDFYSLWGGPWNIPYVASKENEGIPAKSFDESSKVVILQWAARDPVRGYENPLFSLQDYYKDGYADYMLSAFLKDSASNVVIGLENGGDIKSFSGFYKTIVGKAVSYQKEGKALIRPASEFSDKFLQEKKIFPQSNYFLTKDFESENQSFWYNSENYRVFIKKEENKIFLMDIRDYSTKKTEDFRFLPNSQARFKTNTPSFLDSMRFPDKKVLIFSSPDPLIVRKDGTGVNLLTGDSEIANFGESKLKILTSPEIEYHLTGQNNSTSPLYFLIVFYLMYFAAIFIYKKNIVSSLNDFAVLLVPLVFAIPFLQVPENTFAFDKKELFVLNFLPVFLLSSISGAFSLFKIVPLLFLLLSHTIYIVKQQKKRYKFFYFTVLFLVIFLYLHFPYFPLNKSTYGAVTFIFLLTASVSLILAFFSYKTNKFGKSLKLYLMIVLILLLTVTGTAIISRSKYVITPFELEAISAVKNQPKEVLYVTQENSTVPIYKEVRPALYRNENLLENLTGHNWQEVIRPKSNIIKISDYDDKIIVVSKYLGADLSPYEMSTLGLKKIFDNAQIEIYEKK